ncbi:MAG: hypothetical protein GY797_12155 [Deltaproteobacteria bacterium]|nr:hypothetical protein [Deltaproteobacteria bacterium]
MEQYEMLNFSPQTSMHQTQQPFVSKSITQLEEYAIWIRKTMLDMHDGFGCLSGAFSSVELYVALYLGHIDPGLIASNSETRTRVLAKGTATLAFYATLSSVGLIELERLKQYGTYALPPIYRADMVGIDATQYTLGPNLGTAIGAALASKLKNVPFNVVCFMGDGELQEGVDQAAKSAVNLGLNNLTIVVDCNGLQSYYPTAIGDHTMSIDARGHLARQAAFWSACGWQVIEIDGHDLKTILQAYSKIGKGDKPYVILARTIKGKGIQGIEGKLGYQHHISVDQLEKAKQWYAEQLQSIHVNPRKIQTKPKQLSFNPLTIPCLKNPVYKMRETFATWIKNLKTENDGLVFSIDSDCRNIFSADCTAHIVSHTNYKSRHIFPGLNERLSFTIAKGLGFEGLYSVVGCRANNLTDTSEEWNAICVDMLPVLLAGTRPGAIQADWSPLKCSFMDINIMGRHGCQIYQPSNSKDLVWLLECIYHNPRKYLPAYLRIPDFENDSGTFASDTANSWMNGYYVACGQSYSDDYIAIIATGDSLKEVLELNQLYGMSRKIKVLNLFNLYRVDSESLQRDLSGAKGIFSIIEARSSAISELIFLSIDKQQRAIYEPLGINSAPYVPDKAIFQKHGFYGARNYVLQSTGLDVRSLAERFRVK